MRQAANDYKSLGISTVATDANKRATVQWKPFTTAIATDDEIREQYDNPRAAGIAVICGAVSGGLEAIDIDCKYDTTGTLFEDFMQLIVDDLPELAGTLVIAHTGGGGYHILYRCDVIEGNQKLARRHSTEAERAGNPHDKVRVLIETRGEGGYVVAAPTPGYSFIQGDAAAIPVITAEQRAAIFEIARSFNTYHDTIVTQQQVSSRTTYNKSPFQDYNERGDIVALLEAHGWVKVSDNGVKVHFRRPGNTTARTSGDYNRNLGIFAVFTTSTEFEPMKGYRPAAVYCMLECGGDWKEAGRQLVEAGYGEPFKRVSRDIKTFIRRRREDGDAGEALAAAVAAKFSISDSAAEAAVEAVTREDAAEDGYFWTVGAKGKLTVVYNRFGRFLESHGFGLYFFDAAATGYRIVHNDHNRLEEASTERIRKFVKGYIVSLDLAGMEYTQEELLEMVMVDKLMFGDALFEFLPAIKIDFLRDTSDASYYPFRNGIVEITAAGAALRSYGEVNKVIWRSDIIDRNVDLDYISGDCADPGCEFIDFVTKAMGRDTQRVLSTCSLLGYLLHKYKHPARAHAVILGEETDDESKGGGTGKGIMVKALEAMMPTVTIDGKGFKPDKSFAWQRCNIDTKLIVIQDTPKAFSFTPMYSILTEGIPIEKKNRDEIYLRYEDSPKIVITTNYAINDEGNHAKRRLRLVEFSNYFGPEKTPETEYGHLLFNDWDADEWNRFYNFMFWCIQTYLKEGIINTPQGGNYRLKKIRMQYGEEFAEWFQDYAGNGCEVEKELSDVYNGFLRQYDFDKKDYGTKRFGHAIRTAAHNFGFEISIKQNRQHAGRRFIKMVKPQ